MPIRSTLIALMLTIAVGFHATANTMSDTIPALKQYVGLAGNPNFKTAFTARDAGYLTQTEQDIIHIINIMRLDPPAFAAKIVQTYPDKTRNPDMRKSSYYKSLLKDLQAAKPLTVLIPDEALFNFAQCHATNAGRSGYVGHARSAPCEESSIYGGECCQYGVEDALGVVMELLIDQNIVSLGHRKILMTGFTKIGVAMRPHKAYGVNTVIDLGPRPVVQR